MKVLVTGASGRVGRALVVRLARQHCGVDARDVAEARALDTARPGSRVCIVSGSTPIQPADVAALEADAPALLRQRAPALVQAFAARGWALPASIDRVYNPALAMRALRWQPRFGFADVLRQLDAASPELLPPGFLVAEPGLRLPDQAEDCR